MELVAKAGTVLMTLALSYFFQNDNKDVLPKDIIELIKALPGEKMATVALSFRVDSSINSDNFFDRTTALKKQLDQWVESKKIYGLTSNNMLLRYSFQTDPKVITETLTWCYQNNKGIKWTTSINGKVARIKD